MNANLARKQQALRSRSRSFCSPPSATNPDEHKTAHLAETPSPSHRFKLSDIYKVFLLSTILLVVVFSIRIWNTTRTAGPLFSGKNTEYPLVTKDQSQRGFNVPPPESPSKSLRVPLVDRSILQRLADMEISPDPDERPYFASISGHHRPPIVTRIPETKKQAAPPLEICGPARTPCRFLLPLRIAEQESKARIHFMEILRLAQKLDRILVLPNVGKSRLGLCFKSDFEMYYDLERSGLSDAATVKLDLFRRWADAEAPSAQLVFLSAKPDPQLGVDPAIFSNDDVSIRVGASNNSSADLPGCFAKFHVLRLDAHTPLYIHLKPHTRPWPIDASILDALTRPEIHAASPDPAVLVLSWDLRLPIFPPTPARLHYAPRLHALATLLAPPAPYALVHWRMESVPPAALPACAHALVDTLAGLPGGVRTVWWASDYPYALHRRARPGTDYGAASGAQAKSSTFHGLGPLHAEAVGIFGDAFEVGGELEGWAAAELTEARLAALDGWEPELLEDAGVRAIVDKIIGVRAALLVSGTPGCARTSSFTRQVIEERRAALASTDPPMLQNLVEYFG
ncbi:hypothetical protein DFH07DRAFT_1025127 [Mycena maculata]|uniref:Proteophosphoglycan 5 n=1 Tax=Mycena maculata TaxID=230809 RepID=A0AAD7J7B5_9AGAR|nr:hypothetical protein DFH07DRAFT_1025127 [Mycena maculata]